MDNRHAVKIRPARKEDAAAIARFVVMAEGEMAEFFTGHKDAEKAAEALIPFILSLEPCRYSLANNLVAEVDGLAAGAIISFPADSQPQLDRPLLRALAMRGIRLDNLHFEGEPGTYYLSTMGVDPDFRGHGIGSALMAAAENLGWAGGYARCSLLVDKEKCRAQKLYGKRGYRAAGETTIARTAYFRMVKDA